MPLADKCARWLTPLDVKTPGWVPSLGWVPAVRFAVSADPSERCGLCDAVWKVALLATGPDLRSAGVKIICQVRASHVVLEIEYPETEEEEDDGHDGVVERDVAFFHLYAHPDTPCPWEVLKPYPYLSLEWADNRLHECSGEHSCISSAAAPAALPTRIISVGDGPSDVRLVQESNICARYICLSHCWGSEQPLVTTQDNLEQHLASISWEAIPPLYRDTIRLAWRYRVRYVWIDSLCIIQDDVRDWAREAGRMKDVYGNSWLTVAADSNEDCRSGILDDRGGGGGSADERAAGGLASLAHCLALSGTTAAGRRPFRWVAVPHDAHTHACPAPRDDKGACRWPLLRRAWAFQEHVLAPRVLHFSAEQLLWGCRGRGRRAESGPAGGAGPPHAGSASHALRLAEALRASNARALPDGEVRSFPVLDAERLGLWLDLVADYSGLELTVEDDRLPALSGLAQLFQQAMPGARYVAGMWDTCLLAGLTWYRLKGDRPEDAPPAAAAAAVAEEASARAGQPAPPHHSEARSCTPSWSWAAVGEPVGFAVSRLSRSAGSRDVVHVENLRAQCTPLTMDDPTGRVSDGRLHVQGPISTIATDDPVVFPAGTEGPAPPAPGRYRRYGTAPARVIYDRAAPGAGDGLRELVGGRIRCLLWCTMDRGMFGKRSVGLLLEPVHGPPAGSQGCRSTYRRVGLIICDHDPEYSRHGGVAWYERDTGVESLVIV